MDLVDPIHVRIRPTIYPHTRHFVDDDGKDRQVTTYRIRWRVAGHDKTKTHAKFAAAKDFKDQLELRLIGREREQFDTVTGLPVSMLPHSGTTTTLAAAQALVAEEWADWSPHNRRSRIEALADHVANLLPDRGHPGRELCRRVARDHLLRPEGRRKKFDDRRVGGEMIPKAEMKRVAEWMVRNSLPLSTLSDVVQVETLLNRTGTGPDGVPYRANTRQRSRTSLSLLCLWGVRHRDLDANTVALARRRFNEKSKVVEPGMVPAMWQARIIIDVACGISAIAEAQYRAYLTLLVCTGMRPSEASGLRMNRDIQLPATDDEWGLIVLRKPLVTPGKDWTTNGEENHETKDTLKARDEEEVRDVLVPPEAVAALRAHLAAVAPRRGDLVFKNSNGNPIDPSSMSKVWRKARERALDGEFDGLTVYELRHTAASSMLQAGIQVPRVAQQLGNSPTTLMARYARVISSSDDDFKRRMDAMLAQQGPVEDQEPEDAEFADE